MLWASAPSPQSVRRRAASLTRRRCTGGRACPAQCSPQRLAGLRPTCLMLDCDMSMFTSAGLLACAGLRATCSSCDRRGSSTLAPSCTLCPPFSVCLCALGPLTDDMNRTEHEHSMILACTCASIRCFTLSGGLATTTLVRLAPSMAMEAVLLGAWCTAGQLAQKLSNLSVRELPILRQALLFEL